MSAQRPVWHVAAENDYRGLSERPLLPEPTVSVVIPVYERTDLLRRTLAGLVAVKARGARFEVVVADDGSTEDVATVTGQLADRLAVTVVRQHHDGYGAGRARNLGAATASGEVLVFIDADCVPAPDVLDHHLGWHRRADNVVVVGSRRHVAAERLSPRELEAGTLDLAILAERRVDEPGDPAAPDDFRRRFYRRTGSLRLGDEAFRALVSSHFSVRADRFREAGGFDPSFSRWGGEDTELGWRLWNEGLVFVPENRAAIYHQVVAEEAVAPDWRGEGREANDGRLQSKIPHRFYRTSRRGFIYEVPRVSWLVHEPAASRLEDLWEQLLRQSFTDFELVVPLSSNNSDATRFLELTTGDPRVVLAAGDDPREALARGLRASRGELVAVLHGWAAVDHRLVARAVRRLERRPRAGIVRSGYQVRSAQGPARHLSPDDVAAIDAAWSDTMPVFALTRRRDWAKLLRAGTEASDWWPSLQEMAATEWLNDALVAIPAASRTSDPPARVPAVTGDRTLFYEDALRGGAAGTAKAVARYVVSRARGRPYRPTGVEWEKAPSHAEGARDDAVTTAVSYVGWVGKDNMGDEAMLAAIRRLMPWALVEPDVENPHLLMLGGGTLVNRRLYLDWLRRKDSPRLERVVLGTGVASPAFWGQPDDPGAWVDFLDTCAYVGLRGPGSLETLRDWGYRGDAEIIGDPALALEAPAVERVDGRIVLSPAFTKGELWGKDDAAVFAAFADVMRHARLEGREVVFLSCFPGDDRHIFELMRAVGEPETPYFAGYDDHEAALEVVATADVVVAERLHAAVFAAAASVPFVAVEYRPKVRDFAASLDLETVTVRSDAVGDGALAEVYRNVIASRTELKQQIDAAVGEHRSRLAAASRTIRNLLAPS